MARNLLILVLFSLVWIYDTNSATTTASNSTALYFGLMLSLSGDDQSSGALAGVQAALDEINSRDDLLPGYSLHYTPINSECDRRAALDGLFSQLFQPSHQKIALIGSGCPAANDATAEISHYYNLTHISCTSSFSEVDDHKDYFQLLPSEVNFAHVFYSIIKEYGWRRVALIVQNQPRFKTMISSLMRLLSNSTTIHSQLYFDDNEAQFGQITFDPHFRICILAMDSRLARRILCKAHRLGIRYPQYVFLTYGTYKHQWWNSQSNHSDDECSSDDIAHMLQYSLAVSHFNTSMRDSIFYHVCYDAVVSLAYALQRVVENESSTILLSMSDRTSCICCQHMERFYTGNISSLINEQLRNTDFIGSSGPIHFDENGIRHVTELRVLQYRSTHINGTPIHRDGSLSQRLELINVAYIEREHEKLEFVVESKDDIWPSHIPYDGEPREEFVTIMTPVTVIFLILNTSGIIYAVICFMFNAIFHKKRIIRLDSPNLNYLIIIGAILVYFSCMAFVIPTLNSSAVSALCILRTWLAALGYTTMYGSIIAKMWRIYTIFSNPKTVKNKRGIRDQHLILIVLSLTLVDVIVLTIYTIVEGAITHFSAGVASNKEKLSDIHGELEIAIVYKVYTCSTNTWIRQTLIGLAYIYKFSLYVCALYFAFRLRNIKMKGLNDAKYIAGFVYTTSVLIAITFISTVTLSEYINVFATIYSFGFWLAISSILGLLFIPKMVRYYRDPDGTGILSSNDKTLATQTIGKFSKQESSNVDGLKQRVKVLEDLLNKHNIPWSNHEDT